MVLDNRWVVPYNPYLLKKYKAHINVHVCTSIRAVKYLYKYIHKGHDRAAIEVLVRDEVQDFLDARYVGPPEACWRLLSFDMHGKSHVVERLPVHLLVDTRFSSTRPCPPQPSRRTRPPN